MERTDEGEALDIQERGSENHRVDNAQDRKEMMQQKPQLIVLSKKINQMKIAFWILSMVLGVLVGTSLNQKEKDRRLLYAIIIVACMHITCAFLMQQNP
jgi:hypothetical protein